MTPSHASTFNASSIVRSSRLCEGEAAAPNAPGVTIVSWIVDIRASASVDEMPLVARSSLEASAAFSEHRFGLASSGSDWSRALIRAISPRRAASCLSSSSSVAGDRRW